MQEWDYKSYTAQGTQRLTVVFQCTKVNIHHKTMAETDDTVNKTPTILKTEKTQWQGSHKLQI